MPYSAWELAAIDAAGHNGIRDEHLDAVAAEIRKIPGNSVNATQFREACRRAFVDPDNFTQDDINALQHRLEGGLA